MHRTCADQLVFLFEMDCGYVFTPPLSPSWGNALLPEGVSKKGNVMILCSCPPCGGMLFPLPTLFGDACPLCLSSCSSGAGAVPL